MHRKPLHSCLKGMAGEDQDFCLPRDMTVMRLASQHEGSVEAVRKILEASPGVVPILRAYGKVQTLVGYRSNHYVSFFGPIIGLVCKSQNKSI